MKIQAVCAGACVCAVAVLAPGQTVIYSQPTVTDPSLVGLGFFSSNTPRPTRSFKHADNFTVPFDAQITGVRWWGWSEAIDHLDLSNFSRFLVEIFEAQDTPDGLGVGALLFSERFEIAATNPTPTGRAAFDTGALEFRQQVTLTTPFAIEAGRPYFLAVSARSIDFASDAWAWQDGLFVNGFSRVFSHTTQQWTPFQDTDSAFELLGVPSPAGGCALLALLACPRRRR